MDELDELNKRIRELRFPPASWPAGRCPVCGWPYREDGCQPGNCSMRPAPAVRACDDTRDYARDIAAAWELMDEMNASGDGFLTLYAGIYPADPTKTKWTLKFAMTSKSVRKYRVGQFVGEGATAPEAIARAWLAWKEAHLREGEG
jgi:hypothetical protein